MSNNVFKTQIKEEQVVVNEYLKTYFLDNDNKFEEHLADAMRYSYLIGGKRIRPIIMRQVCQAVGGRVDDVIEHSAAIEMIHTYSLIHDDLPAMDDDALRRGQPTNHIKYGEAIAILAGDGLLNYAFELMLDKSLVTGEQKYIQATKILADAAGRKGMIGGQVADIQSEGQAVDADVLSYIHSKKTGALLRAAVMMGGVIGGADDQTLGLLKEYGENLGLAFQIRDDILDVLGDEATLGKPIGSDEKNDKLTYVSMYGLEASQKKLKDLTEKSVELLEDIHGDTSFLEGLSMYLSIRQD